LPPRVRRRLTWALVPLIAFAIAAAVWLPAQSPKPFSITSLLPASLLRTRPVEARVSGLAWAPFARKSLAPVQKAAGLTRGESWGVERQRRGLLELLVGDPRDAVATLEKASATNQPDVWSDLAAAYHEVAVVDHAPELLAEALCAADRALAVEPDRAEALFNRALALDHLGLRIDARAAWSHYLAVDPASGWADEARRHLGALPPERPFLQVLDEQYDRVARDSTAAAALYARDPFGARGQGIVEVLGRWGHAMVRGDVREAARHLDVARQLGRVVARGGDHTLEKAVAAIDRAEDRRPLAAAHADFHDGMKAIHTSPEQAEALLRRAAAAFRATGSPMLYPSSHFAAASAYLQGRRDDAATQLGALLAETPAEFPAYRGFMLWQLGNHRDARGEWGAAIAFYEQSTALFESVGERGNVATLRQILAGIYEKTGDPETAWKNRVASIGGPGMRANMIDERKVWSIAEAAILRRDWHMASSFLAVYAEVVRRSANDARFADALLLRAVVRDRLGDSKGAVAHIDEARLVASRVDDASYRGMLRASESRSVAMLHATPPATAETLLTRAIDYEETHGHPSALPALLLLRARARRVENDSSGALDDLERGIEQLERHRESLPEGAARWGAFHGAEELFEEAVDLAMSAGDHEAAFRYSEEARARALLDSYGATPDADLRAIPRGTVVVEYATLPASLAIFVADANGVVATKMSLSRAALAAEARTFAAALQDNRASHATRRGASLYGHLIAPIASRLTGAETVVFVPDGILATVPFGALVDPRGDYLLQQHAVVVAPSTAAFIVANQRRGRRAAPRSALVVTASAPSAAGGNLQFVETEATRILQHYRITDRIGEDAVQFDELTARGPAADVIHFGGHAVGDPRGYEPASIVLRNRGEERRVGVAEIAKLRLDRTAVVVLAGCSTARGQRRAAEGVISVAHGFLSAGVPSAVATLWPISDRSAARFFPRLHEKLAAGLAPAEALRQVQLEAIRSGEIPSSMWAAVQVIGS